MAKKKAAKKKTAKKKASTKKAAARTPKKKVRKKKVAKKKPAARSTKSTKKKAAPRKKKKTAAPKLGRPKITGDEKLYMLFKDDYHARQIFEFLRVSTVRELEEHTPADIVKQLSKPIRQTVDRIRQALAHRNRCLSGDEEYAAQQVGK